MITDRLSDDRLRELFRYSYELTWRSRDPNTKNSALLLAPDTLAICHEDVNRMAHASSETDANYADKNIKYRKILHAEEAVILSARRDTSPFWMLTPWGCCLKCAQVIIAAGIRCVITHNALLHRTAQHRGAWMAEIQAAERDLLAAGVIYVKWPGTVGGVTHLFDGTTWEP